MFYNYTAYHLIVHEQGYVYVGVINMNVAI